ncbi:hypothetical protein [Tessaracoccus coleopterorum]|uniref:hypothetical protein n=1 Tax=Tessaracoccus coleopterorum TaxID=2714950 RepID=UPI001E3BB14C|nr:hypothetical protein [Tessaracoccus coleopterorum]
MLASLDSGEDLMYGSSSIIRAADVSPVRERPPSPGPTAASQASTAPSPPPPASRSPQAGR